MAKLINLPLVHWQIFQDARILDDSLPRYSTKKRIKNYIDLYFSNSWEDATGEDFPTIILVCETLPMVMSVKKVIKRLIEEYDELESFHLRLETKDQIWVLITGGIE